MATVERYVHLGSTAGGDGTTNRTTYHTIDNAAAVDKGGGLVGIPITGHGFSATESMTITGSVNYNSTYTVHADTTTNEVVITETYAAETFAGTEIAADPNRAYADLGDWAVAEATNLVTDGDSHVVYVQGDAADKRDELNFNLSSWTSGASNTITIQPHPTADYARHNGSGYLDTNIYWLRSNDGGDTLDVDGNTVIIDGLQFATPDGAFAQGVYISDNGTASNITVKNCIFHCDDSDVSSTYAIHITTSGTELLVQNCVFHIAANINGYINWNTSITGTANIYNCACSQNNLTSGGTSATVTAKNCVVYDGELGSPVDTSAYNATTDTAAAGTNIQLTITDLEKCVADFGVYGGARGLYLPSDSSRLTGGGVGSASDSNVPTTDILGNSRSTTAPTIGPWETAISLTEYDYYVNTASSAGGDGTTNATTGANRAFATLNEAEAGVPGTPVIGLYKITIHCCGSTADTTEIGNISIGSGVGVPFTIKANRSESDGFYSGPLTYSTSHYRVELAPAASGIGIDAYAVIRLTGRGTVVDGIQVKDTTTSTATACGIGTDNGAEFSVIKNCRVQMSTTKTTGPEDAPGIYLDMNASVSGQPISMCNRAFNNIIVGNGASYGCGIRLPVDNLRANMIAMHNTISDCYYGIYTDVKDPDWYGYAYNNAVFNCTDDLNILDTDSLVDYNAAEDAAYGANDVQITSLPNTFTDTTTGDYTIKDADSVLVEAGYPNSSFDALPLTDLLGNARSSTAPDIGAFELASGFVPRIMVIM